MSAGVIVSIALFAISLAASYYLSRRAGLKDNFVRDTKPSTLAERGAFIPWLLGRRRVGCVVCWAGDRFTAKESIGSGGKGSKKKKQYQYIYHESAMHALCVGPAFKLHRIWQDGKVIFQGTIDAQSHPSGTTISCGAEGEFVIYWGEHNQPVNSYLGNASRIGVASRWPLICYIEWRGKRLGQAARWPLIDYEIETRIVDTAWAAAGAPWFEPTRALAGVTYAITAVANGVPGTCAVRVLGDQSATLKAGGFLKIAGNAASANGVYRIHKTVYIPHPWGAFGEYFNVDFPPSTDIYLDYTLTGATVSGTVEAFTESDDDGVNPAHALAHLLFGRWPNGLELDTADFDLATLDDLAQVLEDEKVPCSLLAQDGETAQGMVAALMQDHGFLIAWDVSRGKYVFRAVRQEAPANVVVVDPDVVLPPNPEVSIPLGDQATDKLVFIFSDRARNFKDGTIQIGDDGQATFEKRPKVLKVDMPTVISFPVANKIAERRMQEELSGRTSFKFNMNRAARLFVPGTAFTVAGYPFTYRVLGTAIDVLSSKVEVSAILDVFGSKASSVTVAAPPAPTPPLTSRLDLAYTFLEVPGHATPGVQQIIVPRIRAHAEITGADIWLSRDGATYTHVGDDDSVFTGGTLVAQLDSTSKWELDQGPTITALGPDIGTVLDLSGDTVSWRAGRQLVLIGAELFFLKKVTSLGGGQYRLDGLIRARFDTEKATHAAGAAAYIFTDDALRHEDALLSPQVALYMKPQPRTTVSLALSLVPAVNKTLVGKGIAPMPLKSFRAGGPTSPFSNSYRAGEAVTFKWAYRSTAEERSGAGLQDAGAPSGVSPVEGEFVIRFKSGVTVKREVAGLMSPTYTYPNATLVSDFGGSEPASFTAEVEHVKSGYKTAALALTIAKAS